VSGDDTRERGRDLLDHRILHAHLRRHLGHGNLAAERRRRSRRERLDSGGEEGDSGNCGSNVRAGVSHVEATQMFQEATEQKPRSCHIAGSFCAWH
jgi:hypothetical protein